MIKTRVTVTRGSRSIRVPLHVAGQHGDWVRHVWDGDRSLFFKVIVSVLTQHNYYIFLTNHLIETHPEGLAPFSGGPTSFEVTPIKANCECFASSRLKHLLNHLPTFLFFNKPHRPRNSTPWLLSAPAVYQDDEG